MSRLISISILLLVVPVCLPAQEKLQFIGERIDFTINKSTFTINGIYYFLNNSDKEIRQNILFPFAKNTDSVAFKRVYNLTYAKHLVFKVLNNAIVFEINVLPKDSVKVNIAYSQKAARENIYILKSAQTWGHALKSASYSLTYDPLVQIDSLALKPDSLVDNIYYWSKLDFYPDKDFKVWIK